METPAAKVATGADRMTAIPPDPLWRAQFLAMKHCPPAAWSAVHIVAASSRE
jgi:hypothetical protein